MRLFTPPRIFNPDEPEFTDRPDADETLLLDEMKTLQHLNGQSGGYRQAVIGVEHVAGKNPPSPLHMIDLGTGGADVPRTIVDWARRRHWPIEVTAVDRNPIILQHAQESSAAYPEIRFEQQNLLQLPYPANSFDIVMCSLALHHFTEEQAVGILKRIHEMARIGYVINNLRRNWLAVTLVELVASRYVRNPSTRHDAVASSKSAFTVPEFRELAARAGMKNFQVKRHNGVFRMALTGRKEK